MEQAAEKAEAERAREAEAERAEEDVAEAGSSDSVEVTVTVMAMVGGAVAIAVATLFLPFIMEVELKAPPKQLRCETAVSRSFVQSLQDRNGTTSKLKRSCLNEKRSSN